MLVKQSQKEDAADVLQSVPSLPDDEGVEAAALYAPPRRVSVANGTQDEVMTSDNRPGGTTQEASPSQQTVVPICIRIVRSQLPEELVDGIEQLCLHAPRRNVVIVDDDKPLPAYGVAENGSYTVWWWNLQFVKDVSLPSGSLRITVSANQFSSSPDTPFIVRVQYVRQCEAFRGFGHVLGALRSPLVHRAHLQQSNADQGLDEQTILAALPIDERAHFATMGTMIDCSRNGVLRVKTVKFLLKKLAMMGYNMLQLYTEDTYKIDGEPFFGYLRGGYSFEQLREIDDYAYTLGIEVIPCGK